MTYAAPAFQEGDLVEVLVHGGRASRRSPWISSGCPTETSPSSVDARDGGSAATEPILLSGDACLEGSVLAEDGEGEGSQDAEAPGGVGLTNGAGVLAHLHIEHPVERVLFTEVSVEITTCSSRLTVVPSKRVRTSPMALRAPGIRSVRGGGHDLAATGRDSAPRVLSDNYIAPRGEM